MSNDLNSDMIINLLVRAVESSDEGSARAVNKLYGSFQDHAIFDGKYDVESMIDFTAYLTKAIEGGVPKHILCAELDNLSSNPDRTDSYYSITKYVDNVDSTK